MPFIHPPVHQESYIRCLLNASKFNKYSPCPHSQRGGQKNTQKVRDMFVTDAMTVGPCARHWQAHSLVGA